jgi:hypothetical protein
MSARQNRQYPASARRHRPGDGPSRKFSGSTPVPENSQSTDLQGSWSYTDNVLHLSFNEGSLTLDGLVKKGKFIANAVMKTDLGDLLLQDCVLKRN